MSRTGVQSEAGARASGSFSSRLHLEQWRVTPSAALRINTVSISPQDGQRAPAMNRFTGSATLDNPILKQQGVDIRLPAPKGNKEIHRVNAAALFEHRIQEPLAGLAIEYALSLE